jgi:hypothetical protein
VNADEIKHLNGHLQFATAYNPDGSVNSIKEYSGNMQSLTNPMTVPNLVVDTTLRAKTETKALLKIKAQKVNVPQVYAEAGLTVKLVADSASSIGRAVFNCRHGQFAEAARDLGVPTFMRNLRRIPPEKEAHQAWLELQYGWKPLLQDVYGAVQEFADKNVLHPDRLCVKVVANSETSSRSNRVVGSGGPAWTVTDLKSSKCRVIFYIKQNNPTLANAAAQGWSNPASLAWELLPWSFVADWFIPIGDYLGTLDATLGWDLVTGCRIEITENRAVNPLWLGTHMSYLGGYIRPGCGGRKYSFTRTPYTSFPSAALPRFKSPVSTTHMANAIALLRGLF